MDAYLLHVGKYQENTVKSNICTHCWFFTQIRFRDFTETVTDENGVETEVTTSCKCVRVIQGEQVVFKRLDVIFEGNNYVLSAEKNDDNDYLSLYDEIIVEGVD